MTISEGGIFDSICVSKDTLHFTKTRFNDMKLSSISENMSVNNEIQSIACNYLMQGMHRKLFRVEI